mmetsp:Transcript_26768/g.62637  ORF Transcript_26768/g.62637 Transcript_26768/m.62637 type:complete len:201 (+) Transcript_26768:254-856(+)
MGPPAKQKPQLCRQLWLLHPRHGRHCEGQALRMVLYQSEGWLTPPQIGWQPVPLRLGEEARGRSRQGGATRQALCGLAADGLPIPGGPQPHSLRRVPFGQGPSGFHHENEGRPLRDPPGLRRAPRGLQLPCPHGRVPAPDGACDANQSGPPCRRRQPLRQMCHLRGLGRSLQHEQSLSKPSPSAHGGSDPCGQRDLESTH